jgi:lipoate-protein ligase A
LTNKYNFRFAFTPEWAGAANMEADRYFGQESPPDMPLVRFYTWDKPTISLGCNQNPEKRIDLESCGRDKIPVVKRPTGGRELLHGHDLCYSVAMPCEKRINAVEAKRVFGRITNVLVKGLMKMGIAAEWKSLDKRPGIRNGPCFAQVDAGEIMVGGKKLAASAQRVFERCVIQQGSIPLVRPAVDLTNYLRLQNRETIRSIVDMNTAYLHEHLSGGKCLDTIVGKFIKAFDEDFSGPSGPADELLRGFQGNISGALWYC